MCLLKRNSDNTEVDRLVNELQEERSITDRLGRVVASLNRRLKWAYIVRANQGLLIEGSSRELSRLDDELLRRDERIATLELDLAEEKKKTKDLACRLGAATANGDRCRLSNVELSKKVHDMAAAQQMLQQENQQLTMSLNKVNQDHGKSVCRERQLIERLDAYFDALKRIASWSGSGNSEAKQLAGVAEKVVQRGSELQKASGGTHA